MILGNFIGNGSAPMIRREVLDAIGIYDTDFYRLKIQGCEDRDLYLRVAESYKILAVPIVGVGYRRHAGAMSTDPDKMARSDALAGAKLSERQKGLPKRVIRWSRGRFCLYLARACSAGWRPLRALRYASRAAVANPRLCLTGTWWQITWRALKRALLYGRRDRYMAAQRRHTSTIDWASIDLPDPTRRESRNDQLIDLQRQSARRLMEAWRME